MRIDVPDGAGTGAVIRAVLLDVFTEPTVGLCLLTAVFALMLTSANSPNWFAMIADVNPPEHRGTVYSLGNLINGFGRAGGNGLVGVVFRGLSGAFPPPLNYAVGLAAFQLFWIPTGIMFWLASRTVAKDIADTHNALLAVAEEPSEAGPDGDVGRDAPVAVERLAAQKDLGADR
jgi:hypothetical protein